MMGGKSILCQNEERQKTQVEGRTESMGSSRRFLLWGCQTILSWDRYSMGCQKLNIWQLQPASLKQDLVRIPWSLSRICTSLIMQHRTSSSDLSFGDLRRKRPLPLPPSTNEAITSSVNFETTPAPFLYPSISITCIPQASISGNPTYSSPPESPSSSTVFVQVGPRLSFRVVLSCHLQKQRARRKRPSFPVDGTTFCPPILSSKRSLPHLYSEAVEISSVPISGQWTGHNHVPFLERQSPTLLDFGTTSAGKESAPTMAKQPLRLDVTEPSRNQYGSPPETTNSRHAHRFVRESAKYASYVEEWRWDMYREHCEREDCDLSEDVEDRNGNMEQMLHRILSISSDESYSHCACISHSGTVSKMINLT
ncbi:hypothetical protein BT69DRAFT_780496 [Atractiella rhizophila]|nr:hypothetical protein BT69DRAFT_780496 [Atractiella rhizophila]